MLDPLTALGVASNILSFIDFSGKLVSGAISIYGSVDGASKENMAIEEVTTDLQSLQSDLTEDMTKLKAQMALANLKTTGRAVTVSSHVEPLAKLSLHCTQLAQELIQMLQGLKVKGRFKAIKSGVATLKTLLKADDIARYERTLDQLRSQMSARMVALISEEQREMFKFLRQQAEDRNRAERTIKVSTDALEAGMGEILAKLHGKPEKTDFASLVNDVNALAQEWRHTSALLQTIQSLSFESIHERWIGVQEAHEKTFHWAYHSQEELYKELSVHVPSLGDWLREGDSLIWVTGKPGSGKSTFMKYLCASGRTESLLKEWSGSQKLVKASHFFWAAGTPMQRSLQGLLQSLLNDLLREAPELTKIVISEERFHAPAQLLPPWTIQELRECFLRLKTQTQVDLKICFFVDGLDEYEGDHEEVLDSFGFLAQNPNIKFCLASRDWNVFRDWLREYPTLRLEDLTQQDIRDFTQSKLQEDRRFAALRQGDHAYDEMITLIVKEAQGVFLWVFFVVQSLKRGFIEGDTIKDLMRRIRTLPKKLEDFFLIILNAVEEVYHMQCAELLQICQAGTEGRVTLVEASFFDEDDDLFGTNHSGKQRWDVAELHRRCESVERRVRARCRDLVTVVRTPYGGSWYLQFVHRTAQDFVQSEHVQSVLKRRMRKGFDSARYLCQANIALAKFMPRGWKKGLLTEFEEYAIGAFRYSDFYEKQDGANKQNSMLWLENMDSVLDEEGLVGPDRFKRVIVTHGLHNTWLFNMAIRHSGLRYVQHHVEPHIGNDAWNVDLGPRLIKNFTLGSVRREMQSLLDSAFLLLTLGSIDGGTHVRDQWGDEMGSLCRGCMDNLMSEKWWLDNENFRRVVFQFVDELFRRTDARTLDSFERTKIYKRCLEMKQKMGDRVSSNFEAFVRTAEEMRKKNGPGPFERAEVRYTIED